MREAVASYVTRAMETSRGEKRTARVLQVFVRTSAFNTTEMVYSNSATG